ncbi:hypothetical protein ACFO5K_08175 [Nocardia halotolerans]|uniref:Uncharacterized protein n=1 Tax=Nocardia halotolerans TaxID=1755878 RepID=A0ABV8VFL0_9NOCA
MTLAPIYEPSRIDDLEWLVWDRTTLDFVSAGRDEPKANPRRSLAASIAGIVVQRVDIVDNRLAVVRYFEVDCIEHVVAWHELNYPNVRSVVWRMFDKRGDGCCRRGIDISIEPAWVQNRIQYLDPRGEVVAEDWHSDDGELIERREYEYGEDSELSATLIYGPGKVLVDRYEED